MKASCAAVAVLLGSASAFVPATTSRTGTELMAVKPKQVAAKAGRQAKQALAEIVADDDDVRSISLPFATKPENLNGELVGDVGFDPFGFSDRGDLAKFRRAELKHGRVSMLGVVGALFQETQSIQGPDFKTTKNLYETVADVSPLAILQIVAFVGAYDLATTRWEKENGRVPGDIGFDPLRLSQDGINEGYALSELKHGRLAMIAMFAFLVQQLVSPDKSILDQTFEWAKSFES